MTRLPPSVLRAVAQLLAPERCLACRRRAAPPWCGPCEATLPPPGPACPRCAGPSGAAHRCWSPDGPIASTVALHDYRGVVARALVTAKMTGARSGWEALGERLAERLAADEPEVDVVTWVTTAPRDGGAAAWTTPRSSPGWSPRGSACRRCACSTCAQRPGRPTWPVPTARHRGAAGGRHPHDRAHGRRGRGRPAGRRRRKRALGGHREGRNARIGTCWSLWAPPAPTDDLGPPPGTNGAGPGSVWARLQRCRRSVGQAHRVPPPGRARPWRAEWESQTWLTSAFAS
jgi:hypothetical protein